MSRRRTNPKHRSVPPVEHADGSSAQRRVPLGWLAAALIVVVGVTLYANSLSAPLVFDDDMMIRNTAPVRTLWPPWAPMLGTNRPLGVFSFAVNYAIHGESPLGYRLANLLIHMAAAGVLFGIVRRTLSRGRLAERYGGVAGGLALSVALIWMAHPLQTQSVTYIYQRLESLMGLFCLLTLYTFIRAQDSPRAKGWYAASIAFCVLGLGTKEVAAAAPLVVLWYDRALVAGSWRELSRKRWGYYTVLGGILAMVPVFILLKWRIYKGGGTLFVDSVTPWEYAWSQPGVILHYLRLAVWPQGQCIDYGWPVADTAMSILLPSAVVLGLMGLTAWAAPRWPAWGLLGGAFFLILTPSSSFVPIKDLAFEHRMYLPLAAVVTAVVIGGYEMLARVVRPGRRADDQDATNDALQRKRRWLLATPVAVCVVALGATTIVRNRVYRDPLVLWQDVVAKAPHHYRGYGNLATIYRDNKEFDKALRYYRIALDIGPNYPTARAEMALSLAEVEPEKLDEAIAHCREALEMKPDAAKIQAIMARLMAKKGDLAASEQGYRQVAASDPDKAENHYNLANVLADQGKIVEAIAVYRRALELAPDDPEIHNNLATVLAARDPEAAIGHYRTALRLDPDYVDAHNNLASALAAVGDPAGAAEHFQAALQLDPKAAEVHLNLARLYQRSHPPRALDHCRTAVRLMPNSPDAHYQLANTLVLQGHIEEAKTHLREALRLRPDWPQARRNLEILENLPQAASDASSDGPS